MIAEIYLSFLQREVHKRQGQGKILDAAQVRVNAKAYARLDTLRKLFRGKGGNNPECGGRSGPWAP